MALTQTELDTLEGHAQEHPIVHMMIPNWPATPGWDGVNKNNLISSVYPNLTSTEQATFDATVAGWYSLYPTAESDNVIACMNPKDRCSFFAEMDFPTWYSGLCDKIDKNTFIVVYGMDKTAADSISLNLLAALVRYNLTSHSMQALFTAMSERAIASTIPNFIICLGLAGSISEQTVYRSIMEINVAQPRWQQVGISEAPTAADINTIFST